MVVSVKRQAPLTILTTTTIETYTAPAARLKYNVPRSQHYPRPCSSIRIVVLLRFDGPSSLTRRRFHSVLRTRSG